MDLLKCSLLSDTPLTDLFLRKEQFLQNAQSTSAFNFDIGETVANDEGKKMKVRVVLRKSNRKILFALATEDFVDFLFSYLTFPLGGVEQILLKGNSCLGSIDNLYKSIVDLDEYRYLRSPDLKGKLIKAGVAHQFKLQMQILPIDEVPTSNYSCFSTNHAHTKISGYLTVAQAYKSTIKAYQPLTTEIYAPLSYLGPVIDGGCI